MRSNFVHTLLYVYEGILSTPRRFRSRSLMKAIHNNISQPYQAFANDGALHFQEVYSTKLPQKPEVLLVLDSSFNPPHWGHHALIEKGLELYDGRSTKVLLLLAVNNADKAPKPASFDKRIEMMCLMADLLHENGTAVSVGITDYGKYVDKDIVLRKIYADVQTISFLVGFDTIVRIFDSKYYHPQLPSEALREFMSTTELCCLTRKGEHTLEKQMQYSSDISRGFYEPNIPRSWGSKIHMMENDERFESISSSAVRKAFLEHEPTKLLRNILPSSIIEYILSSEDQVF